VVAALRWESDAPVDEALCRDGQYHFLAPSFFKTLVELTRQERYFTVVIRTFGHDLEEVAAAVNAFAAGRHPRATCRHPTCEDIRLPPSLIWTGRYNSGENESFTLSREVEGQLEVIQEENDVVSALELRHVARGVVACMDHYEWWRDHDYHPSAGKPLWITEEEGKDVIEGEGEGEGDANIQHIFFDDNIHNCGHDSIVAARWRRHAGDDFRALSGEETRHLHGCHTVRVQSCEAFVDEDYFLKRIAECEEEWRRRKLVN
jgi:hypothetical protein